MNLDKVNSTQDLNDSFFIIKALNGNILAVEAITKFNDIDSILRFLILCRFKVYY